MSTSISVIGTTVEALTITLDPVVVTSNEDGMTLNTGLHLNAVNTDEAAASLAGSVNPILSVANPAESKLTVGKVMFKTTDGQVLGWSQRLLHDQSVTVPLSPICLSCALSSKQKSATPKKDLGVSVSDIKLAQLTTDSGFSLSTRLSHSTLPLPLSLALGYIGLKVDVSRKPFISIDLPNGINVHSEPGTVDLSTRLIVSHEETVSQRIQSLISTLTTTTTESDSTVGVTGFVIGQSEGLEVVTFSKIVAEVSAGALRGAVAMPTGGSSSSAGKTLAKLNGAEIEVKSASQVKLGAKATVLDVPGGASISLGSLSLVIMRLLSPNVFFCSCKKSYRMPFLTLTNWCL